MFKLGRQIRVAITYTSFVLVPFCSLVMATSSSYRVIAATGLVVAAGGWGWTRTAKFVGNVTIDELGVGISKLGSKRFVPWETIREACIGAMSDRRLDEDWENTPLTHRSAVAYGAGKALVAYTGGLSDDDWFVELHPDHGGPILVDGTDIEEFDQAFYALHSALAEHQVKITEKTS